MEAGSRLIVGGTNSAGSVGGNVSFTQQAEFVVESIKNPCCLSSIGGCNTVAATDGVRIKISGVGNINLFDKSNWTIPVGAFVGIETTPFPPCGLLTDIQLNVLDGARFSIGDDVNFGGSFQVGDTAAATDGRIVNFALNLGTTSIERQLIDQPAQVIVGRQAFKGLGVGVIDKSDPSPDNWKVGTLFNVGHICLNLNQGIFAHRQIALGSNSFASLLALGPAISFKADFGILNNSGSRLNATPNLNLRRAVILLLFLQVQHALIQLLGLLPVKQP